MKDTRLFLVTVALLGLTASARADLHAIEGQTDGWSGYHFVELARVSSASLTEELVPAVDAYGRSTVAPIDVDSPLVSLGAWGRDTGVSHTTVGFDRKPKHAVVELPPAPSSLSLFLSAMISAGAWHLSRSARHMHFGAVPEWYHTGCPDKIGHAVPFDFGFSAPPLCCFEQPAGELTCLYRVRREQAPVRDAQCILTLAAPRGPPTLS